MSEGTIQILSKGPAIVAGHIHLIDDMGNTIKSETPIALCRCGKSETMPFCDSINKGHMKTCQRAEQLL
ncbi:MAG TPA: CDGSH iron-sulfur domain-containing protein [Syntrophomonadaceae bacterium]|nr:CDGSH iron-sulfur domain-containing protein [Syntrophomonadaceae bacterium]